MDLIRAGSWITCAATLSVGLAGCGAATPTLSPTVRLEAVCNPADHALLEIDVHKFPGAKSAARGLEVVAAGNAIVQTAREAQQIDARTAAKVERLPRSPYTAPVLLDLSRGHALLGEVIGEVRRRGVASDHFPRSLLLSLVRASGGCGVVKLTNPSSS